MSRQYFYKLISNAAELKELHEEAVAHGKLEVGLSRGKILYIWDEERQNIRTVKPEEAAERLGLTLKQVDQIIATNAEVVFDEPEEQVVVERDVTFQEEGILENEPLPEVHEEIQEGVVEEPVEEPVEELPIKPTVNTSVDVQEALGTQPQPQPETHPGAVKDVNSPIVELVEDIITALEKFKNNISN